MGEGPIFWEESLIHVDTRVRPDPSQWGDGRDLGVNLQVGPSSRCKKEAFFAGDSGIYSFDPDSGTKTNRADPYDKASGETIQ